MLSSTNSRLIVMIVMLVFQFLVIGFELQYLLNKPSIDEEKDLKILDLRYHYYVPFLGRTKDGKKTIRTKRSTIRQSIVPVIFTILGIILFSITFSGKEYTHPITENQCRTNLDADISGDGVRMSIWAQEGVLVLVSFIGIFHNNDTGVKEVGGGLILTHASLAIALIVQMKRGSLTSVDAAIGSIILDAQNMALQIPLAAKESLAARWQVVILIPTQLLGMAILPILITRLTNGDFASEDCKCLYVFWWSWLSDCSAFPPHELSVFWVYYSLRCVMFVQSSYHSLRNAPPFDAAEKSDRQNRNEDGKLVEGAILREVKCSTVPDPLTYDEYPATISLTYTIHALFALTSMAVAEITIRDFDLRPSSQINSVGQIIAIVVAAATIVRALWKFLRIFDENRLSLLNLLFGLLSGCMKCPGSKSGRLKEQSVTESSDSHLGSSKDGPESPKEDYNLSRGNAASPRNKNRSPAESQVNRNRPDAYGKEESQLGDPASPRSHLYPRENISKTVLPSLSKANGHQQENALALALRQSPRKVRPIKLHWPFRTEFIKRIYLPELSPKLKSSTPRVTLGPNERGRTQTSDPEVPFRNSEIFERTEVGGFAPGAVSDDKDSLPIIVPLRRPKLTSDEFEPQQTKKHVFRPMSLHNSSISSKLDSVSRESLRETTGRADTSINPILQEKQNVWEPSRTQGFETSESRNSSRSGSHARKSLHELEDRPATSMVPETQEKQAARQPSPIRESQSSEQGILSTTSPSERAEETSKAHKLQKRPEPSTLKATKSTRKFSTADNMEITSNGALSRKVNVLILDGGGLQGLTSLIMLQTLMKMINPEKPPKPWQYFDMIGGSGTGGVIALMLGRLRMSVKRCIVMFSELLHPITLALNKGETLGMNSLAKELRNLVEKTEGDREVRLLQRKPKCKIVIVAKKSSRDYRADSEILRNFSTPELDDHKRRVEIWRAALRTLVLDPLLRPLLDASLPEGALEDISKHPEIYNPIKCISAEATSYVNNFDERFSNIVSLGTGRVHPSRSLNDKVLEMWDYLRGASRKAEEEAEYFRQESQSGYIRLSSPPSDGTEEWFSEQARSVLEERVNAYVRDSPASTDILKFAQKLKRSREVSPSPPYPESAGRKGKRKVVSTEPEQSTPIVE